MKNTIVNRMKCNENPFCCNEEMFLKEISCNPTKDLLKKVFCFWEKSF